MNIRKVIRKEVRKVMDNVQSKNNVKDSYLDGRKINSEIKRVQKSLKRYERDIDQKEAQLKEYDKVAKNLENGLDTVIRKIDGQPYTLRRFKNLQERIFRDTKETIKVGKENIKKLEKMKGEYKSAKSKVEKEYRKWIQREKKGIVNQKEDNDLYEAEKEITRLENEFEKIQKSNSNYKLHY